MTLSHGAPAVTPGPGRAGVVFSVQRDGDRVQVVPNDVAPMVAAGQLDAALFDVTLLLASGYGDRQRDDVPLIITGVADAPGFSRGLTTGVVVDRALPALRMVTARQPKASGGAAVASLRARGAGAPTKIWLDRVRTPVLDHSVPQIGGPAAHARGLTGAGITVAVLDTGVDSTHPDLVGKVVVAEDFTGDGQGVLDVLGHGTHVASIIAGSGAASGGQLAGVAPDAQLVSGRVCVGINCPDSAILAGMEWAAIEQGARVINLSLGATDTAELDPLEDAVNQLSAATGALFVIAAGNVGFVGTIQSPGSADAALTVGAIDRDDQLAAFSSRGPRTGDRAIKPEVTAPGVDIVAARAANVDPLGEPVGTAYMALSGTSMATPHVAGAAALVLQQHATWTGAQVKAQLIATAHPNAALTAFDQGAGRIDVDRGTRQDVTAEPATLSLGVAAFPHDDDPAIVRTVRYTNGSATPITLALAASLSSTAGGPTPPGMVQVDPASVTVPAGGSSEVTVTVTTSGDLDDQAGAAPRPAGGAVGAPPRRLAALVDGLYSGALVATGGGVRVVTPIGVDLEVESFELAIDVVDQAGAPTAAVVFIFPATGIAPIQFIVGHATFRLPRDRYAVDATMFGRGPAFLAYPRLALERNTAITLDGRQARPIAVDVGDPGVRLATTGWQYFDYPAGRSSGSFGFGVAISAAHLGPEAPPSELVGMALASLSDDVLGSPTSIYNLAHQERGHLPTGWTETIAPGQLATVRARHAGQADAIYGKGSVPILVDPVEGLRFAGLARLDPYVGPFERVERYFGPGFVWSPQLADSRLLPEDPEFPTRVQTSFTFPDYRPGRHLDEQWNQAVFAPAFPAIATSSRGIVELGSSASRTGDELMIAPSMVADSGAPPPQVSTVFDRQRIALFRNGTLVEERLDVDGGEPFVVPPGAASYRYEQAIDRPASLFPLSTHVAAAWTFRSQHVGGDRPRSLPLPTMRFHPPVDPQSRTAARLIVLPISFDRPPGAATPPIVHATLEVSFDDGARWSRVPVVVLGDRALAVVLHPRNAQSVSLRGSARDLAGNQIEQTIVRAYGLR